ncbi:aldo/keto reductase [Eubacterium oxidoreducens]|uniref:4Fe-4S ferredoxin-type domain-containing protein n=1 Tax=Eubacterium oxidoreducens TaxID=1732 RepID=A0A1G6CIM9_EUBOX|nr:aldo/keto reductase [Eubacterium oxidoreducens]SDB32724.1 hypothetical protein SAMN02910417_02426 [Eubacterium oxidoreducens]
MIYSKFQDIQISKLGFGAMRLPKNSKNDEDINQEAVQEMVDYAMAHGVNYYDTAWGYHNGQSEIALGKALKKHPRENFYLASKFPGYDLSNMPKVKEIFEKQLEKCQVEYFDFYLIHNVCEMNIEEYLNPKYGIYEYLMEQKKNGRIKHLGFSAHGDLDVINRFLEAYGEGMEFGQLQINYIDWTFQNAKAKTRLLSSHNLPVIVMEPVRGGMLAKLAPQYEEQLKRFRPDEEIVAWAFRFLQTLPEVFVTLSGMSNLEQVKANIATYEKNLPLTQNEKMTLQAVVKDMLSKEILPCTACRYCTNYCPKSLEIPELLAMYNEHKFTKGGFLAGMRLQTFDKDKRPDACIACRKCEVVCPQNIKISEAMADFAQMMSES